MSKINYIQMNNHYEQYINKEELINAGFDLKKVKCELFENESAMFRFLNENIINKYGWTFINRNDNIEVCLFYEEEKNMNNNNNWEVNVQEIDLNEVKKEEQKMNNFIKVSVPTWRTTLITNGAKIEYRLGNELNFFYVNSKFIYLNKTKEGNFFFTISLLPQFEYDVYLRDDNGHDKYKLNGQELVNQISYWKEKAKNNKRYKQIQECSECNKSTQYCDKCKKIFKQFTKKFFKSSKIK